MSHAAFTRAFMAGADQVSDIDGDGGLRGVRKDQQAQAIRQLILGDPFDGGDLGDALRQSRLRRAKCHCGQT